MAEWGGRHFLFLSLLWWKLIVCSLNVLSRSSSMPICAAIPLIILLDLHVELESSCVIVNSPHQLRPLNFLKHFLK